MRSVQAAAVGRSARLARLATRARESLLVSTAQLAIAIAILVVLQAIHYFFSFIPSPLLIAAGFVDLVLTPQTYHHLAVTFGEALSGILIAFVSALMLGLVIGLNEKADRFFSPIILAIYAVPKIVFLPVLMLCLGTGFAPKIGNAMFHAFFPIVLNTIAGVREVKPIHIKLAQSMQASRNQMLFQIFLPSMVLPVFSGLRLAVGLAVLGAVLAELFESTAGVGYYVMKFHEVGDMAHMIATIVLMLLIIVVLNKVMQAAEQHLSHWRSP